MCLMYLLCCVFDFMMVSILDLGKVLFGDVEILEKFLRGKNDRNC